MSELLESVHSQNIELVKIRATVQVAIISESNEFVKIRVIRGQQKNIVGKKLVGKKIKSVDKKRRALVSGARLCVMGFVGRAISRRVLP